MTVAIIGVGMMGESLLAGLLRSGWDPATIRAADSRPACRQAIADKYGVWTGTAVEAVEGADTVIVVVKPQDVIPLLGDISPALERGCLIISLAAGLTIATIESSLVMEFPVVRVMPNTPAVVGEAMAVISPGPLATHDHVARTQTLMSAVGKVLVIAEKYLDVVTAVSGSGPAYIMYIVEAMIDAGVMLGLPRATVTDLVKQTVYGSAKMLLDTDDHPTVLKENVTSPGGTTAAALRALEDRGVKAAFAAAMEAAFTRSQELGRA
ncbi:MAG: pyrroline-5-carboxylate reductase [Propionibacteriaceae bacterium]|nr:pyrroline-5-carboxylate reductase [Propionibacteriaceae bacterium]